MILLVLRDTRLKQLGLIGVKPTKYQLEVVITEDPFLVPSMLSLTVDSDYYEVSN
jgi:hypothetical protein